MIFKIFIYLYILSKIFKVDSVSNQPSKNYFVPKIFVHFEHLCYASLQLFNKHGMKANNAVIKNTINSITNI